MSKNKRLFIKLIAFAVALVIPMTIINANNSINGQETTASSSVDIKTNEQKRTSLKLIETDKKILEEISRFNELKNILIKNGISNPNEKQIKAIEKMNQYISNNNIVNQDFNNKKTLIFAFEGAGSYNNKWSKTAYHTEGRYGAMFIVVKNKEVAYITANGSTLPDNPSNKIKIGGTLRNVRTLDSQRENISNFRSGNHTGYPGLISYNPATGLDNNAQKVKSLEGRANNGFKMNIHSGRSVEDTMSEGCLTIRDTDYISFAKTVGHMPGWVSDDKNNIESILKIGNGKFVPNITATLILDRTLMDQSTKNKFWKQ